ncbi:hypothetical protein F5X96DRAFT_639180 [Biscogniauxia mediterranea]|nr:hypothetical protein F5X96DRAFT_639180 [Biscogniauxia mediterranea]
MLPITIYMHFICIVAWILSLPSSQGYVVRGAQLQLSSCQFLPSVEKGWFQLVACPVSWLSRPEYVDRITSGQTCESIQHRICCDAIHI